VPVTSAAVPATSAAATLPGAVHGRRARPPRPHPHPPRHASASPSPPIVLRLVFDTEGGSLVRTEFLKHADLNDKSATFVLLDDSPARVYVAQTGLIGGSFPTHKTAMAFSGERTLKDGANELVVKFESSDLAA
jgi:YidC/Oxa1 family membrane protein insertase